jgi:hypothetical protein
MSSQRIQNASSATAPMTLSASPSRLDRVVEIQKTETGKPIGSGILIAPQWVLTAAHLSLKPRRSYCAPLWVRHHATGVTKQAVWWRLWTEDVDLGMLYLGDTENIPGEVVPIEASNLAVETKGWVVGFGETSGTPIEREFEVLSHCGQSAERIRHGCYPTMHVVIHGLKDTDLIHGGDSGAPFFVESEDGTPRLAGIVLRQSAKMTYLKFWANILFGKAYEDTSTCRDGVCTRVDVHKEWIDETPRQDPLKCTPTPYNLFKARLLRLRDRFYF